MNIRPRFSIRALFVLITLCGVYFGCWEVTKRWGLKPPKVAPLNTMLVHVTPLFDSSPAPFVISRQQPASMAFSEAEPNVLLFDDGVREYFFWFFGYTAKLPFERDIEPLTVDAPTSQPSGYQYDVRVTRDEY